MKEQKNCHQTAYSYLCNIASRREKTIKCLIAQTALDKYDPSDSNSPCRLFDFLQKLAVETPIWELIDDDSRYRRYEHIFSDYLINIVVNQPLFLNNPETLFHDLDFRQRMITRLTSIFARDMAWDLGLDW